MTNWERSILNIHDEHMQFRFDLTKYLNFTTKFNGYRFFWEMLPMLRFTTKKIAPGFTDEYKEIYLSIPWENIKTEFSAWEFIYYHECLHQMFDTFDVARRIKADGIKYNHTLLNVASDCIINDHIKNFCKLDYPNDDLITPEYLKEAYQIEYNVREDDQYTLYVKLLEKEKELMGDPLIMKEREGSLNVDMEGEGDGPVKTRKVKTTDDWKKGSKEARKAANDILQKCQNALNKKPGEVLTVKEAIKALQDAIPDIQKLLKNNASPNIKQTMTSETFHVLNASEFLKINEAESADQIEDGLKTYDEGWDYAINDVLNQINNTLMGLTMSRGGGPKPPTPQTPPTTPDGKNNPPTPPREQIVPENDPTEEAPFLPKPNRGKGKPQPMTPETGNSSDDNNEKDPSEMTSQEASDSAQKDAKRAENAAQKAEQNAKDMQNNSNASQDDIDEANQNAKDARDAANNAKQAAQDAKNAANNGDQEKAQQEAQNARNAADDAEEKAGIRKPKDVDDMSGREAAVSAQKDADRAKKAADKAQKIADQMKNDSTVSQEDKDEAQQKADAAKTAADNAQESANDASNAAFRNNAKLAQDKAKDAKDFANEAESLAKDNELSNMNPNDAASNARKEAQRADKAANNAEKISDDIQNNPNASAEDKQKAKENAQNARSAANNAKSSADKAKQAADNNDSGAAKKEAKNAKDSADEAQKNASDNESIKKNNKPTGDPGTDVNSHKANKPDKTKAKDFVDNETEIVNDPDRDRGTDDVVWNPVDRDDDSKRPGNEIAEIKAYAQKLGEMSTEEAEKIIKQYAQTTDNMLKDYVKKCSSAEKNQKGVIVQTKFEKTQYSWAHQFSDIIKNTVRQRVSKRAKDFEETYRRPNRRQGIVHDNDIIKKGQIPVKDRLTISIAFYVDCSGSMGYVGGNRTEQNVKNIFKFIYELSDVIMKKYHKNPIVEGCVFDTYAFNEEIKKIKRPNAPTTNGGTMDLNRLMNNINQLTPNHMINVIITDAEMNFNINDIKNELKQMAGLCVFITNDSGVAQTLAPLNDVVTSNKMSKFKFIKVPGDFNISSKDFANMKY